jgi:hypothetical protein
MIKGRYFVWIIALFFGVQTASAQKIKKVVNKVDSVLTARYWRAKIDTNYITRPETKWTILARMNVTGASIETEGIDVGGSYKSELNADFKSTLCAGVSYMGVSVSLALNPAKLLGKYKDYELNFRSYGRKFGFDIAYQDAHNFKGWYELDGVREDITTSDDMFKLRTFNVNGYYVFNHRKFSYPAAFSHSYIQRRSAGSFLLAASGQGQHGKVNSENENMDFKLTNIAIGAGYGYNFVPGKGWLIHISVLPTYVVYSTSSITVNDIKTELKHRFPEGIITGRSAIVKQIGRNKVAGLSTIYSFTTVGSDNSLAVRNQKWRTSLYFGVRL